MNNKIKGLALASVLFVSQSALALTVGFSQVGSESGWRTAFSESMQAEAAERGINLQFSDAQQKQENQIKAIRSFIAQGVDAIMVAPVVETGWRPVFLEARRAGIPVIVLDRNVDLDDSYYLTRIATDFVEEGRKAARWLMEETDGNCDIVELQGTVGSSAALDRMEGFNEVIADYPNAQIIRSQTAEFTRTQGKTVMESMLKAENGGEDICALWAHNDEMALGAIQAMEEAGLNPGEDILVVSVDAVDDIFVALDEGDANVSVELSPHLGGPAFDVVEAYMDGERDFDKWIQMDGRVFTQDNYQDEYQRRMNAN